MAGFEDDVHAAFYIPVKPWTSTKRSPIGCSLLPLASHSLHFNNKPFHYVAPTSTLSTDQSRFLDDTHGTVGVECSWPEMLGPLRKGKKNCASRVHPLWPGSSYGGKVVCQGNRIQLYFYLPAHTAATYSFP